MQVGSDKKEKPLSEVKILKAVVFTNPIPEADAQLEQFIASNMRQRIASSKLKAVPSTGSSSSSSGGASKAPAQIGNSSAVVDGASNKLRKIG